ncbi:MAG: cob(I)yrinic acid a,c-diamide adenosyltransferase [Candidatus Micrarchaeota archaeon]
MARSYTKNGDDGSSSFGDGSRHPKSHIIFEAVGTLDELSSTIGIAKAKMGQDEQLSNIQRDLLEAGSIISGYYKGGKAAEFEGRVQKLERWVDEIDASLPELKNFILPGGCPSAAYLHHARTVARRAERRVQEIGEDGLKPVLVYMNRLSSYFFARARHENLVCGVQEKEWK